MEVPEDFRHLREEPLQHAIALGDRCGGPSSPLPPEEPSWSSIPKKRKVEPDVKSEKPNTKYQVKCDVCSWDS